MLRSFLTLPVFLGAIACSVAAQSGSNIDNPHRLVQLEGIQVTGTRYPAESIVRISGLKIGQMINDDVLKEASNKITSTGLMKGLDYGYEVRQGKPGVYLTLKVFDEGPLLPAHIYPPEDTQSIWSCLQAADPIFQKEMPNTANAIHFYSINMSRCIQNLGAPSQARIESTVACDNTGKSIAVDFHVIAEREPAK